MNVVAVRGREKSSAGEASSWQSSRPVRAVKLLLPAWGYRFVRQFLDFSLPTLLSPGNVPALARALPCEFVLLTSREDAADVLQHPAWQRLSSICSARVEHIDDLIFDGGHAVTVTWAYARAIRATQATMRDTCFMFLLSDYILADGALANVLARIQAGNNGVLAGNFHVVAEDVTPQLRERTDPDSHALTVGARDLMALALPHLHTTTSLDMVGGGVAHQRNSNRLFWRVDADTLIGRFYLLHMIAIRPEVSDFEVCSACDYSFVPEMCPSDKVAIITDSDDYLVVEMHSRSWKPSSLAWGPVEPKGLATRLSHWTTARHRKNAASSLVFHASTIPADTVQRIAEADAFIAETSRHLSAKPISHRDHPYWTGGVASHRALGTSAPTAGSAQHEGWFPKSLQGFLWRLRFAGFGPPPNMRPWHPRWPDFQLAASALAELSRSGKSRILVVSNSPETFRQWKPIAKCDVESIDEERLLAQGCKTPLPEGPFDACVIFRCDDPDGVNQEQGVSTLLDRVRPQLTADGRILVVVTADISAHLGLLSLDCASRAHSLVDTASWSVEAQFIRAGWLRRNVQQAIVDLARAARQHGPLFLLPAMLLMGLLLPVSYLCNLTALKSARWSPRRGECSGVMLTLRARARSDAISNKSKPARELLDGGAGLLRAPSMLGVRKAVGVNFQRALALGGARWAAPPREPEKVRRQTPPKQVKLVLPVWGYKFVRTFLEQGLPTLLAPGNVPALAAALPCEFIILTSYEDAPYLQVHPAFRRLCEVCHTEIRYIDHLITGTNYSTTITLAYTEAVRATGDAVTDTAFFFLVSDYIMADGSFANILKRMMNGASGVLVGNFQVVYEDALPWLQEQLNRSPLSLSLSARELMRWGLSHLHPTVIANTVNHRLSHNNHTNRLFWRVDGNSLIGRFYLMHMICIRPEVAEFVIGSACDYSFIPEMCPSGNVDVVTDSDEYLVIEMQPRAHEAKFLRPGPLKLGVLAKTMSEWTTQRHRQNAGYSVVFHGTEPSSKVAATIAAADLYVNNLSRQLKRKAKSHRNHPYWRGALASFHEATGKKLDLNEWRLVLGLPDPATHESWVSDWIVEKIRFAMFGRPPTVRPWHPRWIDFHPIIKKLKPFLRERDKRLLMISDMPTVFTASLADSGEKVVRIRTGPFLLNPAEVYDAMSAQFDICLLELTEGELGQADELIDRVAPLMRGGGEILVAVNNRRSGVEAAGFGASIAFHAPRLLRPAAEIREVHFVPASQFRWRVFRTMMRLGSAAQKNPVAGIPMLMLTGWFLGMACFVSNMLTGGTRKTPPKGLASSVLFVLKVNNEIGREAYKYSASRIVRQRQRRRRGIDDARHLEAVLGASRALPDGARLRLETSTDDTAAGNELRDGSDTRAARFHETTKNLVASIDGQNRPLSDRRLDLKNEIGLATLGLTTNQIWHEDPRRLVFLLARYKFVAKMLKGRRFVGEVGCGDAFGSRVVLQEVDQLVAYDLDPTLVDDVRLRGSARWPIEAYVHDIVLDTLPHKHDAIYSLDMIERMRGEDEHAFLSNLRGSLETDGVLIIGSPSSESQSYASAESRAARTNCKSGMELKTLMEQYFDRVFLFSMNDEVVHTGFHPMAHYLLVVCSGAK